MFTETDRKSWDECLQSVSFAYNTSIQETTGYSPFFLVYGRKPRIPFDNSLHLPINFEYLENIKKYIIDRRDLVKNRISDEQDKMENKYNKNRRIENYNVGDKILVFSPRQFVVKCVKLIHEYNCPFIVIRRINEVNYKIENIYGRKRINQFLHSEKNETIQY